MRIVIIGSSGSGKTTLGRRLSHLLQLVHIELDAFHWLPRWVERDDQEFRAMVDETTRRHRDWVCDGNYLLARDLLWDRASHIVWLNYSFPRVFWQVLRRTFLRWWRGETVFSGNRESLKMTLLTRHSILLWVLQSYGPRRREFAALAPLYRDRVTWLEFNCPAQTEQWFRSLDRHSANLAE